MIDCCDSARATAGAYHAPGCAGESRSCGGGWTTQSGFSMSCELPAGHAGDCAAKVRLRDHVETWTAEPEHVTGKA